MFLDIYLRVVLDKLISETIRFSMALKHLKLKKCMPKKLCTVQKCFYAY